MSSFTKEKQTDIRNKLMVTTGETRGGGINPTFGDQLVCTVKFKMANHQGPTVEHTYTGNLLSILVIT